MSKNIKRFKKKEEMTSTSGMDVDIAFFAKKWKNSFGKKGLSFHSEKKRTCYNCDEANHFADKCPYEKREDKPKYERGVKPRFKRNPVNERYKRDKRREGRALVGASTPPMKEVMMRIMWWVRQVWLLPYPGHSSPTTTPRTTPTTPTFLTTPARVSWQEDLWRTILTSPPLPRNPTFASWKVVQR
jgi:hypothetical protein